VAIAVKTEKALDYYTIIPDEDAGRVLVVPTEDGRWTLPHWRDTDEHHWQAVDHVNRLVRSTWGLKVTTLRCLCNRRNVKGRTDCRIYEMETHGGVPMRPAGGGRWVGEKELDTLDMAEREHRLLLRTWLLESTSTYAVSRAPWARAGWLAHAVSWMLDQLKRLEISPTGPVEQLRAWQRSCILRVPTTDGNVYLKAMPQNSAFGEELEFELISFYAEVLPSHLAIDPQRRWCLLREPATAAPDLESFEMEMENSVQALARVQQASIHHTIRYIRMGAADRRLRNLPPQIDLLLGDTFALRPQRGNGLSYQEVRRLRDAAPYLNDLCERLVQYKLPSVLEHGVLFRGESVTKQVGSLFLDWSEAAVAHPFFAVAINPMFGKSSEVPPAMWAHVRDAYLQSWTNLNTPDHLLEAFEIAEILAPLHYAVSLHQMGLPSAETQWEIENSLPYYLRLLLSRLK